MTFTGTLQYKSYEDESGNIISIIPDPEEEEMLLVVCLSQEGDVEHISAFTVEDEDKAIAFLDQYCENNNYKESKPRLGYAFNW